MADSNPYTTPSAQPEQTEETYQPVVFALKGRIGRLRYLTYGFIYNLIFYAALVIAAVALGVSVEADGNTAFTVVIFALYVVLLVFTFALCRRRLNDLDKSGWMTLLLLVPLVNVIVGFYMLFARGTQGNNGYGPAPAKNPPWMWVGVFAPVVIVGILAAVALPAYQDYVARAQAHAQQSLQAE